MLDPNAPAFPTENPNAPRGLTVREEFAARMLAGLIANNEPMAKDATFESYATAAVAWADALIEALNARATDELAETKGRRR